MHTVSFYFTGRCNNFSNLMTQKFTILKPLLFFFFINHFLNLHFHSFQLPGQWTWWRCLLIFSSWATWIHFKGFETRPNRLKRRIHSLIERTAHPPGRRALSSTRTTTIMPSLLLPHASQQNDIITLHPNYRPAVAQLQFPTTQDDPQN